MRGERKIEGWGAGGRRGVGISYMYHGYEFFGFFWGGGNLGRGGWGGSRAGQRTMRFSF